MTAKPTLSLSLSKRRHERKPREEPPLQGYSITSNINGKKHHEMRRSLLPLRNKREYQPRYNSRLHLCISLISRSSFSFPLPSPSPLPPPLIKRSGRSGPISLFVVDYTRVPSLSRTDKTGGGEREREGKGGKGARGQRRERGREEEEEEEGDGESATTCTWVCYGVRRTTGGGTLAPAEMHPI